MMVMIMRSERSTEQKDAAHGNPVPAKEKWSNVSVSLTHVRRCRHRPVVWQKFGNIAGERIRMYICIIESYRSCMMQTPVHHSWDPFANG